MKKIIRSIFACAVAACMVTSSAFAAVTITPSVNSITLSAGQNQYSFDIRLHVDRAFAGAEFGIKVSDGSVVDTITLDKEIRSVSNGLITAQTVRNNVRYFGFAEKENIFKAGNYKIASINGTYSGNSNASISMESSKIVYVDGETSTGDTSAIPFKIELIRSSGSGGSGGNSGGSSETPNGGASGNSSGDNGSPTTILPDNTVPLSGALPFKDVRQTDWFYNYVKAVFDSGLMNGVSSDKFSPEMSTQRAMIVTILYRMEKEPSVSGDSGFSDVIDGAYYDKAVRWAVEKGIAKGYEDGRFKPSQPVSRQELAAFLYRYASFKGFNVSETASLSQFSDNARLGDWAKRAVEWSVGTGIITGMNASTLNPSGTATRAQLAAMLTRFVTKYKI
ncbi:MAG: S-layer homology domain-containing protein [Anaerovoracaceae bacterium]